MATATAAVVQATLKSSCELCLSETCICRCSYTKACSSEVVDKTRRMCFNHSRTTEQFEQQEIAALHKIALEVFTGERAAPCGKLRSRTR